MIRTGSEMLSMFHGVGVIDAPLRLLVVVVSPFLVAAPGLLWL